MILRKPYAFLIKYFKAIHITMFIFFSYLVFALRKIYVFFVDYVKSGSFTYIEGMSLKYVSPLMFIMIILILAGSIGIFFLMRKKDKPLLFYKLTIIHTIVLLIASIYFAIFFKSLDTTIYPPLRIVINRDIIMFIYYLNFVFVVFSFIRGFGFDIKKFSFDKDKKELNLEEADSEEYEFTVNVDKEDIITYLNRQKREFIYYLKINSKILIIIGAIAFVSLTSYFLYDRLVTNKVYRENQVITMGSLKYIVNNSYITNINKYGEENSKDSNYLIVDFTIQNDGNSGYLDDQTFRVYANDKYYYLSKSSCDLFNDLGVCYHNQKINGGSKYNFIGVYKLDKEYHSPHLEILKSKKKEEYVYTKIKINLKSFDKKTSNYSLNDPFTIDSNTHQVTSYKIYNKTTYKYEECNNGKCNKFEKFVKPNIGEYVLAIDLLNLKELSDNFIKNSFGLKYNDHYYSGKDLKIIDYYDNTIYLSVSGDILKSDNIVFVINTRYNEYDVTLGASNYE